MVEVPDSLRSVFSATVHEQDGAYVVELPLGEIDHEAVIPRETYRVAILESTMTEARPNEDSQRSAQGDRQRGPPEPPVEEGEVIEPCADVIWEALAAAPGPTPSRRSASARSARSSAVLPPWASSAFIG